ncbi:DUF294 nucleotidyltransferase-like domain-containing protein [Aquincola tertiaricarbonis]|uniref:DUF294 nucleotidyltransferase-like domain-containing protein n=1 Tax=Aquincola tertiaricarbonis TaxID=391953 RepID=A0ABY4SFV1_AQUTE|nr:putative nucleotidyltransferase substrate binding domain-containing protein [Aquincola tertiaricarbonis]URI11863.1 DUF294 nucleotidyltransferase-like domain-containing protein [Aquincola tertiaricarbonis]
MPSAFNFSASPFDCLTADERQLVRDHVDIAYFREGDVLLQPGEQPAHLFVLIKGHVHQYNGDELVDTCGPDDCFDGRALVAGQASSRFVAAEEVLAYQLAREAVTELIRRNATFGALLFADLSQKLSALAERGSQRQMQSLAMARVQQAGVRPVQQVDAATDVVAVVRVFAEHRTDHVLVRDDTHTPPRLGIFTTTGLQRAILQGTPLQQLPVGRLASWQLVTVAPQAWLFEAQATMIRHRVRRLVVADAPAEEGALPRVHGTLDQVDLLSFLSNHSYLITREILEATGLHALAGPAERIQQLVGLLHGGGTPVGPIARLVQALNAQLFERTWRLVAPDDLVAHSCLFVMGSEGRGEQLLKTDQDNGLVLADGHAPPDDLPAVCERFSAALAGFGYPECPGRIMVNQPAWRASAGEWVQRVRSWLLAPTAEQLMSVAILMDAHAVCGDARLLQGVRTALLEAAPDHDALLARFAGAIHAFDGGSGWWTRLLTRADDAERLDIKKAGLFPIVHGVRALALAHRIGATGTAERIEALAAEHRLPAELADALVDSLHFFMTLRLRAGLEARRLGQPAQGIAVSRLSTLDRDLLKDTLEVVRRFKALLDQRFRLDLV